MPFSKIQNLIKLSNIKYIPNVILILSLRATPDGLDAERRKDNIPVSNTSRPFIIFRNFKFFDLWNFH